MNASPAKYRDDIETPPPLMQSLPIDRGYPVPWFVGWIDGKPEFRAMDPRKFNLAIEQHLCWLCGTKLGKPYMTFVAGPMCGINRTSAEPPCHLDCAIYSAVNCPFLSRPHMVRREGGFAVDPAAPPGMMIDRNPGVVLLWTTTFYRVHQEGRGRLFEMGDPNAVQWYAEGRKATRAEVMASVESGLPILRGVAAKDPRGGANKLLDQYIARFMPLVPTEAL